MFTRIISESHCDTILLMNTVEYEVSLMVWIIFGVIMSFNPSSVILGKSFTLFIGLIFLLSV